MKTIEKGFVLAMVLAMVMLLGFVSVAHAGHGDRDRENRDRDRGDRVAVDRERYLKAVNQLLKDIEELDDRNENNPKKDDRKWIRERLEAMRSDLQGVRGDLENAPPAGGPPFEPPPVPPVPPVPPIPPPVAAMTSQQFGQFVMELKKQSFDRERLALLKEVAAEQWFTTDQVIQAMNLFSFSSEKIAAGTAMYPHVVDRESWYRVYSTLSFSSDQEKLRKQTSGK